MSRKRAHRMRPEVRENMQRGILAAVLPSCIADRTQPHTEADVVRIMNPVQAALVCMLDGAADDKDFARLGACINLAAFRIQLTGAEVGNAEALMERLMQAGAALKEAERIKAQHGRYGLTGPGRHDLSAGVEVYRALVEASSPYQMHLAENDLWKHLGRLERQAA